MNWLDGLNKESVEKFLEKFILMIVAHLKVYYHRYEVLNLMMKICF